MMKSFLHFIVLFVLLVLAQAVVFNHVALFNVAYAFVFIYFIARLPISLNVNWVIFLSFLMGFTIDIFSNTPGMNALSCTIIGAMRKTLLMLYMPRENDAAKIEPRISTFGIAVYLKFIVTLTFLYCLLIFIIESFTFLNIWLLLLRVIASTALTTLLITGIDNISIKKK